jgi:hypothetical protein
LYGKDDNAAVVDLGSFGAGWVSLCRLELAGVDAVIW